MGTPALQQLIQHTEPLGKIEFVSGTSLRGWIFLPDGSEAELEIIINGERAGITSPTFRNRAVQRKFGSKDDCGFKFSFDRLSRKNVHEITVREIRTGFHFETDSIQFCPLVNAMRISLKNVFFPEYYRTQNGLESLSNDDAFENYIEHGIYADRNPNPWFSSEYYRNHFAHRLDNIEIPILSYLNFEKTRKSKASESFDPRYYIERYPDLGGEDPLHHYVKFGHKEGRQCVEKLLPETILQETLELSALEPDLEQFCEVERPIVEYPKLSTSTYAPRLIKNRLSEQVSVVICVPFLSCGGADLISTFVLKAYQLVYGKAHVVLLITDRIENNVPQWIDTDTNVIYLDSEAKYSTFSEKVQTLHSIIGLLSPDKVININSHVTWEMYRKYGRQLASAIDLYAYLFCFDYTPKGQLAGYIRDYIPKTVKYLKTAFCDNRTIIDDIQNLYGFSQKNQSVFKTVYVPIPNNLDRLNTTSENVFTKKILWISRLARQKRPDVLVNIAKDMPEHTFVVYGPAGDSPASDSIINGEIPNIDYRGVFGNIAEVDLSEYSLFLNTSEWDGLPTILIQIMGAGLPIVTSKVGGITELVTDDTGWLIEDGENCSEYCKTIKNVLIQHRTTQLKVSSGLKVIDDRHRWTSFQKRLDSIGAFTPLNESERRSVSLLDRRNHPK
ncbi:MAG: glycosyltransferase family 4 protein [Granulosicoccus sp.]